MRRRGDWRTRIVLLLLFVASITATPLWACSVPVFRYALERWASDGYRVTVLHRGPLTPQQKALVDRLDPEAATGPKTANLKPRTIDVATAKADAAVDVPADVRKKFDNQKGEPVPWMVLQYPGDLPPAWSGPLTDENITSLLDSPTRREIARHILKGETAVWVLLESGDEKADAKAYETLQAELVLAAMNLKLPDIEQKDVADGLVSIEPEQLKIGFTTIRVSRDDPAEKLLVEMLLGSEGDGKKGLRDSQFAGQPMAFPIFGRGRVLYALVGSGIDSEMIGTACKTLIGPCTCEIKEKNPGTDLLMSVAWQDLIVPTIDIDKELPPLAGMASFVDDKPRTTASPKGIQGAKPTGEATKGKTILAQAAANEAPARKEAMALPEEAGSALGTSSADEPAAISDGGKVRDHVVSSGWMRNTWILIAVAAAGVLAASLLLVARKG